MAKSDKEIIDKFFLDITSGNWGSWTKEGLIDIAEIAQRAVSPPTCESCTEYPSCRIWQALVHRMVLASPIRNEKLHGFGCIHHSNYEKEKE